MAVLPSSISRKFNPADYKTAPAWFTGRFLSQLNLFTDPVYTALLNGLTFQNNFNAQVYTIVLKGATDFTMNTFNFKSTIQGSPIGVLLISKNIVGNQAVPIIGPIDFSWYDNSGTIFITGVAGLIPGTTYSLVFLVF
jgi:hypothetical protein